MATSDERGFVVTIRIKADVVRKGCAAEGVEFKASGIHEDMHVVIQLNFPPSSGRTFSGPEQHSLPIRLPCRACCPTRTWSSACGR